MSADQQDPETDSVSELSEIQTREQLTSLERLVRARMATHCKKQRLIALRHHLSALQVEKQSGRGI